MAGDPSAGGPESRTVSNAGRGVLLLHGLGGSPAWIRPWSEYLTAQGYSVSTPLLPGHGTSWQDLGRTRWTDWYRAADDALTELRDSCTEVAVGGLSVGGALALRLALERADEVVAIVLVNPSIANPSKLLYALPVLQHLVPSISSGGAMVKKPEVTAARYDRRPLTALQSMTRLWGDIRPRLSRLKQPILLFTSVADGAGGALCSQLIHAATAPSQCREILLYNSYHLATLDYDASEIFRESAAFLGSGLASFPAADRQVEIR